MARFCSLLALALAILLVGSPVIASDVEQQLLGVWKLESLYTESRATGEKKMTYGEKPNGYAILTPEKRVIWIVTAEGRKKPVSDEDRIAAFRSMIAYTGVYRIEADKFVTKVDVSWNEAWTGTEQARFFKIGGDTMTLTTPWLPEPNTPGNPEVRFVVVWSKVKTAP